MNTYLVEFIHPDWPDKVEFRQVCRARSEENARYIAFQILQRCAPYKDGLTIDMARVTEYVPPEPEWTDEVVLRFERHRSGAWRLCVDEGQFGGCYTTPRDAIVDAWDNWPDDGVPAASVLSSLCE